MYLFTHSHLRHYKIWQYEKEWLQLFLNLSACLQSGIQSSWVFGLKGIIPFSKEIALKETYCRNLNSLNSVVQKPSKEDLNSLFDVCKNVVTVIKRIFLSQCETILFLFDCYFQFFINYSYRVNF